MRKPIAVIIAEDKIPFRETLAASLEDYGISVIAQAGNGLELLAHLKIREPDIILLDLRMPEMDGSETMNQLANEHPQIKVIILSYHDSPMVQDDYAKRGAKGYVCKDELVGDIRGLVNIIETVHNGGKYFNYDKKSNLLLSERQKNIVRLMADSKSKKEIANELKLTPDAVYKQQKKLSSLLKIKKPSELMAYILHSGLNFLGLPRKK